MDEFFAGAILNVIKSGSNLDLIDLGGSALPAASETLLKQVKQKTKRDLVITLPNGDKLQQIPVQAVVQTKKQNRWGSSHKRTLELNLRMFTEDAPKVLFKAECGRVLNSEKLTYCEKCMEVYSSTRCRKDPASLFDPYKVEVVISGNKLNFGKNTNEKVCPVCCLILKDSEFSIDKTKYHYLQCKFCLWNTLNYNFINDSPTLYKFANALYKRHQKERETEMGVVMDYIRQKFNLSNKVLALKEQKLERAQGKGVYINLLGADTKNKEIWTSAKLYAVLEKLRTTSLGSQAIEKDGARLAGHTRLYPSETGTEITSNVVTEEEVIKDKDAKDDGEEEDSGSESSGSKQDETAETSKSDAPKTGDPSSPSKNISSMVQSGFLDSEVDVRVNKAFVDNPFLFNSDKSRNFETVEEFIASSKSDNVNSTIFEQLPTKIFRGADSFIPIHSILIPQNNKFCPKSDCRNGMVYYDKGSEAFTIKYSTEFSKYFPTLKIQRAEANNPAGFNSFTVSMRNKTKYSQKLHFRVPDTNASKYRFKGGETEFEFLLSTSETEGGKMSTDLTFEVAHNYTQDIVIPAEVNLIMEGAEALTVKTEMVLQFGDLEEQRHILEKYK